ncbi:hypothetical protein M0R45_017896 [Rubus argutus]|uniref:Uncharacterized protein n=1 Tax=Rubus argutus TaxID=59490 RepID=A0AAW1XXH0_RUBAR
MLEGMKEELHDLEVNWLINDYGLLQRTEEEKQRNKRGNVLMFSVAEGECLRFVCEQRMRIGEDGAEIIEKERRNRGMRREVVAVRNKEEERIVIGLQTGNQRVTREGNRGTRTEV